MGQRCGGSNEARSEAEFCTVDKEYRCEGTKPENLEQRDVTPGEETIRDGVGDCCGFSGVRCSRLLVALEPGMGRVGIRVEESGDSVRWKATSASSGGSDGEVARPSGPANLSYGGSQSEFARNC